MGGKCFVDTDILVYAHDRSAGVKHLRAQMLLEQLWTSGWGVLSAQVLEELCIQLCHNAGKPLPVEEVCLMVRDYSTWDVVTPTPALVLKALEAERRLEVPFWDALILETAKRAGRVHSLFREFGKDATLWGDSDSEPARGSIAP